MYLFKFVVKNEKLLYLAYKPCSIQIFKLYFNITAGIYIFLEFFLTYTMSGFCKIRLNKLQPNFRLTKLIRFIILFLFINFFSFFK